MKYYKDENNQVWAYEDDVPESTIKKDLTSITTKEADELLKPVITSEDIITNNELIKSRLLDETNNKLEILQDIVDLDMQESNEDEQLKAWKKYRILLTRIDTNQLDITWPDKP